MEKDITKLLVFLFLLLFGIGLIMFDAITNNCINQPGSFTDCTTWLSLIGGVISICSLLVYLLPEEDEEEDNIINPLTNPDIKEGEKEK